MILVGETASAFSLMVIASENKAKDGFTDVTYSEDPDDDEPLLCKLVSGSNVFAIDFLPLTNFADDLVLPKVGKNIVVLLFYNVPEVEETPGGSCTATYISDFETRMAEIRHAAKAENRPYVALLAFDCVVQQKLELDDFLRRQDQAAKSAEVDVFWANASDTRTVKEYLETICMKARKWKPKPENVQTQKSSSCCSVL